MYRLLFFIILISGCKTGDPTRSKGTDVITKDTVTVTDPGQLNISILWDLSDRIDTTLNPAAPQYYQRDIEIIKHFTELFKKDMDAKGAYVANQKIKVFFTPTPSNQEINNIAQKLSVDLSQYQGQGANIEKKKIYDNITETFVQNANEIYRLTVADNKGKVNWDGADIWRFFKNNVHDCIEPGYRNVLVILTDGYIFHKDSRDKINNRTAFILPETLKPFRNNNNWKQLFDSKDYGLIKVNNELKDLEVLVLEINPSKQNRNDEDYIKAYLDKWFAEMGISKSIIYPTDLPTNTLKHIESFVFQ